MSLHTCTKKVFVFCHLHAATDKTLFFFIASKKAILFFHQKLLVFCLFLLKIDVVCPH